MSDWTAGENVPLDDFMIPEVVAEVSADEAESQNVQGNLPPGTYLLRVAAIGKELKKQMVDKAFVNGQPKPYPALSISVGFADENNTGQVWENFLLPPADMNALYLYHHATNAKGTGEGFRSKIFYHFINRLIPGSFPQGAPPTAEGRNPKSWIGKKVWAIVEENNYTPPEPQIDPETGRPKEVPIRTRVKAFSFREFVPGQPCPLPSLGGQTTAKKPSPKREPVLNGVGGGNDGAYDNGLDDI